MNKSNFIESVAKQAGVSKRDCEVVLETILDEISEILSRGEEISFIGFGSFSTIEREARETRIPGTDRVVNVPAMRSVKFRAGKNLKEKIALKKW